MHDTADGTGGASLAGGPRAWPEALLRNRLARSLLRHQFWRHFLGRVGPRYILAPVGEGRMYLDLREVLGVSRYLLKHGRYDAFASRLLREWVDPASDVIDVGANIGYYSILAARSTRARVYALEPEPHSFALLRHNLALNRLDNVVAIQKAAGDRAGTARLFLSEKNAGDHTCFAVDDEARAVVEIDMVPLDAELRDRGRVSFVKVDVQGFEERVLRGMAAILSENRDVRVLSEFEPTSIRASGGTTDGLFDFMDSLGFGWQVLDEGGQRLLDYERAALPELCGERGYVNLLFHRG